MKRFILLAIAAILTLGANAQQVSKGEQTVTIQTNGVCQKCADKFKENVPYFKGVKSYSYDMKTAKLTINYDAKKTNPDQLRTEVSKLGYNADNVKADPAARAKLPACCRAEKGAGGCSGHGGGQGCGNHGADQKSCAGHAQGGEHKCANAQGGEHKCANAQGGEHKCANAQSGEHKCANAQGGEHKCANAQSGEKKACDHHAPDASKAEAEGNPNKHNVKNHPEDPDRVRK
jgi:copper chaperone CopZ